MRPLHVVLDQIRWDARFDAARFQVRWTDRTIAIREEPLTTFLARRDVPHHRVRQLLCDRVVVWDRSSHLDAIPVATTTATSGPASCAFWNVQDDDAQTLRLPEIVGSITASGIPCWGLVEVTDELCERLTSLIEGQLFREGSVAVVVPAGSWQAQRLPLPGRDALLVSGDGYAVAVAHLTSSVRGDRSDRRREQREALARALPGTGSLLVMIDANSEEELPELLQLGLTDIGADAGPTWRGTAERPQRRLDRILVRGFAFDDVTVERTATCSDHWPLLARRHLQRPRRIRDNPARALCILPTHPIADALSDHRSRHDGGAARWPAHLNVAFPFLDDDDTIIAIARGLGAIKPWPLRLGKTARFGTNSIAATASGVGIEPLLQLVAMHTMPGPGDRAVSQLHLTLSTDGDDTFDVEGWQFDVDELAVLARDDHGRYVPIERLVLGGGGLRSSLQASGFFNASTALPDDVIKALQQLPGSWCLVGSTARGVRFVDSDYDIAWTPPDGVDDPLAIAQHHLGGERLDTVAAPRISTTIGGHAVDVVIDNGDAQRAATSPLDDEQLVALRALRLWARQRDLKPANNNGMPSSIAWLGLVQAHGGDAAAIVVDVWRRLVDAGDIAAVSGTGFRGVTPKALNRLRHEAARALALVGGLDDDAAPWRTVWSRALSP